MSKVERVFNKFISIGGSHVKYRSPLGAPLTFDLNIWVGDRVAWFEFYDRGVDFEMVLPKCKLKFNLHGSLNE